MYLKSVLYIAIGAMVCAAESGNMVFDQISEKLDKFKSRREKKYIVAHKEICWLNFINYILYS